MPPAAAGKKAPGANDQNFRARRLSVSDIDTSEFDKAKGAATTPTAAGARPARQRRMSMSPEMGVVKPKSQLPFDLTQVGTYSCHGVEPGMRQGETSAKINQDRGCICYPFAAEHPKKPLDMKVALFCVYDGHGALGDEVSHYVMNNVENNLAEHPMLFDDPGTALKQTFVKVDNALRSDRSIDAELSGTTGVVLFMTQNSEGDLKIWSANVGDSRATCYGFMCTGVAPDKALETGIVGNALKEVNTLTQDGSATQDLTMDQKPNTPSEESRIKANGGFVSPPEEEWGGPARVWLDANMTLPGLAMARSIGDHLVSSIGVIAEPKIEEFTISAANLGAAQKKAEPFIVMASDGVWEFIESHQATKLVAEHLGKQNDSTFAVTKLIETAAAKWRQEEGDYRDDITAIVIRLNDLFLKDPPEA